jgi:hypothetical protein
MFTRLTISTAESRVRIEAQVLLEKQELQVLCFHD